MRVSWRQVGLAAALGVLGVAAWLLYTGGARLVEERKRKR